MVGRFLRWSPRFPPFDLDTLSCPLPLSVGRACEHHVYHSQSLRYPWGKKGVYRIILGGPDLIRRALKRLLLAWKKANSHVVNNLGKGHVAKTAPSWHLARKCDPNPTTVRNKILPTTWMDLRGSWAPDETTAQPTPDQLVRPWAESSAPLCLDFRPMETIR